MWLIAGHSSGLIEVHDLRGTSGLGSVGAVTNVLSRATSPAKEAYVPMLKMLHAVHLRALL